ncbi:hypothetical protein DACRYDRAFT_21368 [Dacryopinax primogenitus]|uniref:Cytochrome b561 domain-containing protein n=1 Tax=Dacryopinax primogenitus (strain DJM 731) TaxID=1858805 RepID=M5G465_DACPD|nr:uncharacterized protein DACRYDRAFT_21368 [Dacryopinax primogenitus]EJU03005.1 hypothetical protein DACRYDRAFT_21368 [Dacryopinax primogenitus]
MIYAGLFIFILSAWYLTFLSHGGNTEREWFIYHPTLQSIGIALLAIGIQTLQPTATPSSKASGLMRHQYFQLTCLSLLTLGTASIVLNKFAHSAPHLISWHAVFGLIAYLWLIVQSSIGAATVWFNGRAFGGETKAKRVWKYHRLSGYMLTLWMLTTAWLAGEWSGWARMYAGVGVRAVGFGMSLALVVVGLGGRVRTGKMKVW